MIMVDARMQQLLGREQVIRIDARMRHDRASIRFIAYVWFDQSDFCPPACLDERLVPTSASVPFHVLQLLEAHPCPLRSMRFSYLARRTQ